MNEPLRPCPFCGAAVTLCRDDSYGGCSVGCTCDHEPFVQRKVGEVAEVVAAWNRRAVTDREVKLLALVRAVPQSWELDDVTWTGGVYCADIDGVNWFDAREQLLREVGG